MKLELEARFLSSLCLKVGPESGISKELSSLLYPDLCSCVKPYKLGAMLMEEQKEEKQVFDTFVYPSSVQNTLFPG